MPVLTPPGCHWDCDRSCLRREDDLEKIAVARLYNGAAIDRLVRQDATRQRRPIHFGAGLLIEFEVGIPGRIGRAGDLPRLNAAGNMPPTTQSDMRNNRVSIVFASIAVHFVVIRVITPAVATARP
jgi:hypothetical protein